MSQILFSVILGPLYYLRSRWSVALSLLLLVILLTALTQVGGLMLWLTLPILATIRRRISKPAGGSIGMIAAVVGYLLIYGMLTGMAIPRLAPLAGRVALPCFANETLSLAPANILYCALNRHYVHPQLKALVANLAKHMSKRYPDYVTLYLDANLPFLRGFPLLPHLSHNDGRKIDLAFAYRHVSTGEPISETASPIGYWAFETPKNRERDACPDSGGPFRWHFTWLQPAFSHVRMDPERTREMVAWLTTGPGSAQVRRVFIEPHLKARLRLRSNKVRFQGCRAARHDDHIHVELL